MKFDEPISQSLRAWAKRSPRHEAFTVFCATRLIYVVAALALAYGAWQGWETFERIVLSFSLAWLITLWLQLFFRRERPYQQDGTPLINLVFKTAGFPSGHTTMSFGFASAVFWSHPTLGAILGVLSLLVGLGRVWVGVHYLTDILAGAVVGTVVSFLLFV